MNGEHAEDFKPASVQPSDPASVNTKDAADPAATDAATIPGDHSYTLHDLAYTRSGDKGNSFNIGKIDAGD